MNELINEIYGKSSISLLLALRLEIIEPNEPKMVRHALLEAVLLNLKYGVYCKTVLVTEGHC